jgi:hypothetical protein
MGHIKLHRKDLCEVMYHIKVLETTYVKECDSYMAVIDDVCEGM